MNLSLKTWGYAYQVVAILRTLLCPIITISKIRAVTPPDFKNDPQAFEGILQLILEKAYFITVKVT